MNYLTCRYNKNHKVKPNRLFIHEENCPDKKNKGLKTCPYFSLHKVNFENLENHKKICQHRPKIDKKTEEEMKYFILNYKKLQNDAKNDQFVDEENKNENNFLTQKKDEKNSKKMFEEIIKFNEEDYYDNISELSSIEFKSVPHNVNNVQNINEKEESENKSEFELFDIIYNLN